ncbi:MAG: LLM class F420-dependent oxidoreductase [Gammaproteobacteria bacterium]|nr:LLM class F420-dependent oxidoreductase [Gammaproteobacteria bacterium]
MKLSVEFPSVAYREGPAAVARLARAIEGIGFDQLDIFDHVVMGYPTQGRGAPIYPPKMPIMEALMTLAYAAAVTERIGLGTEVLVLPQRQPTLVAKQLATLDTLSGGRARLGVGVGWQASEYQALGEDFSNRGQRMDEAIQLIRAYWSDARVDFQGEFFRADAMAMEPKPPQGGNLPIWVGGGAPRALKRVGELADGWLAPAIEAPEQAARMIEAIRRHAEAAGRDPDRIGLQMMLGMPPRDDAGKGFYGDPSRVVQRASQVAEMGFEWIALNATAIFQAGFRSIDAMTDKLGELHQAIRAEVGAPPLAAD